MSNKYPRRSLLLRFSSLFLPFCFAPARVAALEYFSFLISHFPLPIAIARFVPISAERFKIELSLISHTIWAPNAPEQKMSLSASEQRNPSKFRICFSPSFRVDGTECHSLYSFISVPCLTISSTVSSAPSQLPLRSQLAVRRNSKKQSKQQKSKIITKLLCGSRVRGALLEFLFVFGKRQFEIFNPKQTSKRRGEREKSSWNARFDAKRGAEMKGRKRRERRKRETQTNSDYSAQLSIAREAKTAENRKRFGSRAAEIPVLRRSRLAEKSKTERIWFRATETMHYLDISAIFENFRDASDDFFYT